MVKISKKEIIKKSLILLSIYFVLTLSYNFVSPAVNSFFLKINQKIANSFNAGDGFNNKFIVFEIQDDELVSYIKNPIKRKGLAADTSFVKLNVRTHLYMPLVIMLSIIFIFNLKNKKWFIISSLLLTLAFVEFKIWLYILDQSNHFLIITENGEHLTKINEGIFPEFWSHLNKVINVKGAIFIRYITPVIIASFLYFLMESKEKLRFK
jgi:hypothetical protein